MGPGTDVIVLYHFIYSFFNSGIVNRTLSQMCGRLYFPIFLLRVGLLALMYIASDSPGQAVFLPAYNFKVLPCCIMATAVLMSKNWRWGLQVFLKSFTKCFSWFSYIFFLTVNPPTTVAVNDTVLLSHSIFILWWHQDVLKCLSSLEVYSYSMFATYVLYTFTYASSLLRNPRMMVPSLFWIPS